MGHRSGYAVISSRIIVQMKPNNYIYLILVNGKIKQWRFFSQTIQTSNIPSVCALINAYHNTRVIDPSAARERAAQMFLLLNRGNRLKRHLDNLALGENKPRWKKYDCRMIIFPACSEQDVWNICFDTLEKDCILMYPRFVCLKVTTKSSRRKVISKSIWNRRHWMKIRWASSSNCAPITPIWFELVSLLDIPVARTTSLLSSSMRIPTKTQLLNGSALVHAEAEYLVVVHT